MLRKHIIQLILSHLGCFRIGRLPDSDDESTLPSTSPEQPEVQPAHCSTVIPEGRLLLGFDHAPHDGLGDQPTTASASGAFRFYFESVELNHSGVLNLSTK